jgi:hypothetical protein
MTSKHPVTAVAISGAIALKLLAGTAHAAVPNGTEIDGRKDRVLLSVLHDASAHHARGIEIAGIDGEIV